MRRIDPALLSPSVDNENNITDDTEQTSNISSMRLVWLQTMTDVMMDTLLDGQRNNRFSPTSNGTLAKEAFQEAVIAIQAVTPVYQRALINIPRIRSKFDHMKKKYKIWEDYLGAVDGRSGWTLTNEGIPHAAFEVMEKHFKAFPKHRQFRDSKLEYCDYLEELLTGNIATEEYAEHPSVLRLSSEEEREEDTEDEAVDVMETMENQIIVGESLEEEADADMSSMTSQSRRPSVQARVREMSTLSRSPTAKRMSTRVVLDRILEEQKKNNPRASDRLAESFERVAVALTSSQSAADDPVEAATRLIDRTDELTVMEKAVVMMKLVEKPLYAKVLLNATVESRIELLRMLI